MVTQLTREEMEPGVLPKDDYMHVIMFYGETCGPCKMTMPNYEIAADFYRKKGAKIKFYKFHAWESTEIHEYCKTTWELTGVPLFKVFYQGKVIMNKLGGGDDVEMFKTIHEAIDEAYKQTGEKI